VSALLLRAISSAVATSIANRLACSTPSEKHRSTVLEPTMPEREITDHERPDSVADAIAELLSIDPEDVMVDGRSGRISLKLRDAANLLKHAEAWVDAGAPDA